jgi:hypothetical protein
MEAKCNGDDRMLEWFRPPSQMKLVTVARISYAKLQQVRYFELRVPAFPRWNPHLLHYDQE